jgi:hypothetical protein
MAIDVRGTMSRSESARVVETPDYRMYGPDPVCQVTWTVGHIRLMLERSRSDSTKHSVDTTFLLLRAFGLSLFDGRDCLERVHKYFQSICNSLS